MNQLWRPRRLEFLLMILLLVCWAPLSAAKPETGWGFTRSEFRNKWGYYTYPAISEKEMSSIFDDRLRDWGGDARKLSQHFLKLCDEYEFDPAFVLSIIDAESTFRVKVVSKAGAVGLMQLMPATAKAVARKKTKYKNRKLDLKNPFVNLELGILYLNYLRHRYRSQVKDFLGAYNMGPNRFDEFKEKNYRTSAIDRYVQRVIKGIKRWREIADQLEQTKIADQIDLKESG